MTEIPVQHEFSRPGSHFQQTQYPQSHSPPRVSTPPRIGTPPNSQTPPRFYTLPRNHRERAQAETVREIPIQHFSSADPQSSRSDMNHPRPDYPGAPMQSKPQQVPPQSQSFTSHATAQGQQGLYPNLSQGHQQPSASQGYQTMPHSHPVTQTAQGYPHPTQGYPLPPQGYPQPQSNAPPEARYPQYPQQQFPQGPGFPTGQSQMPQSQGQAPPQTTVPQSQNYQQQLPRQQQCPPPPEKQEVTYNIPIVHEQAKEPRQDPNVAYQTWPRQQKPQAERPVQSQQPNTADMQRPAEYQQMEKNKKTEAEPGPDQMDCAPSKDTQKVKEEERRSRSSTPTREQKRTPKTQLDIVNDILTECQQYKNRVNSFSGCKKDKEYKFLEEMLTRSLLKLDGIESGQDENIRQARKGAVREIQSYLDQLELKAFSEEMSTSSQNSADIKSDSAGSGPEKMDESSQNEAAKDDRKVKEMVLDSEVSC